MVHRIFKFFRLGHELSEERKGLARLLRRFAGHMGLGYAIKLWSLDKLISKYVNYAPSRVLDFGCSDGMYTFYLHRAFPHAKIYGIDGDQASISRAKQAQSKSNLAQLSFDLVNFDEFEVRDDYDLIVCLDSIYYGPNGLNYLSKCLSSLSPNGVLILSVPFLRKYYKSDFEYYTGAVDIIKNAEIYAKENIQSFIQSQGCKITGSCEYPSALQASLIELQRKHPKLFLLFYPLFFLVFLIFTRVDGSSATHFMLVVENDLSSAPDNQ